MPGQSVRSRAALLLLFPGLALAGQLLQGSQVRIHYGDLGLWNDPDTAVEAGLQFYDTGTAQWLDISWPGTAWARVFIGYTQDGTAHTVLSGAEGADWTVETAADTAAGGQLIATHRFTSDDLQIDRVETWDEGGAAVWTEWTLTNTGSVEMTNLRLTQSLDADPDSDALANPQPLTYNDTLDLDSDTISEWVESQGVVTGVTVGFGKCDTSLQEVGHYASNTFVEDPDLTLTDEGGGLQDYTMNIRHTSGTLKPGASVTFSTITALGATATLAQHSYLDAREDACGIMDFDRDEDGFDAVSRGGEDCDDFDPDIHPKAEEVWYDGTDQDCDGNDTDADEDGHDAESQGGDDCDDDAAEVYPDAEEVWYDGTDQDCDGNDTDADGDGFASVSADGRDCDDTDASVNPAAEEVWYDGTDQDCDDNDADADGDGFIAESQGGDDCDDDDRRTHPAATEVWYDGADADCDGADDYDADADGHLHEDYGGDDCNDFNAGVYPGAAEVWYDGTDADCDGASDYDADSDGHDADVYGGDDCNDADPAVWKTCGDKQRSCSAVSGGGGLLLLLPLLWTRRRASESSRH